MSFKIELGKVYKCKASLTETASINVVSGEVVLKGTNVVKYTENNEIIRPKPSQLTQTKDKLGVGIHLLDGLPEWICFEGTGEVWASNCIDLKYESNPKIISGGGSIGSSDYNELENKPQINGIELTGNKSAKDLGLIASEQNDIQYVDITNPNINLSNPNSLFENITPIIEGSNTIDTDNNFSFSKKMCKLPDLGVGYGELGSFITNDEINVVSKIKGNAETPDIKTYYNYNKQLGHDMLTGITGSNETATIKMITILPGTEEKDSSESQEISTVYKKAYNGLIINHKEKYKTPEAEDITEYSLSYIGGRLEIEGSQTFDDSMETYGNKVVTADWIKSCIDYNIKPLEWGNIQGDITSQTDLNNVLNLKVNSTDIKNVAKTGSYNDLIDTPTIPSVDVNKKYVDEQIITRAEKTVVKNLELSTTLANNTIFKAGVLENLTLVLPTLIDDFVCQVEFTSGTSATSLTAPSSIKWLGDDTDNGALVPQINSRYVIMFYSDGVSFRAISQKVGA